MSNDDEFDSADINDIELRTRGSVSTPGQKTEEVDAVPYDDADNDDDTWNGFEDDNDSVLPGRPRRVYANRYTAALAAVIVGAACFYAGVRVEKSKVGTGSGSALGALASRFAGAGGGSASASGASATGRTRGAGGFGGAAGAGFSGGAGGFGGAAGGAGGATVGTVSSIDGDTIYVTDTAGNTVAVKLSSSTTIKKSESVGASHVYPGDTLIVSGSAAKSGTVAATSVTDSGASTTGSTTGGSSSSSSSGSSGSSGLSSLF